MRNELRCYHELCTMPPGLVAVGDSVLRLNPIYAQVSKRASTSLLLWWCRTPIPPQHAVVGLRLPVLSDYLPDLALEPVLRTVVLCAAAASSPAPSDQPWAAGPTCQWLHSA